MNLFWSTRKLTGGREDHLTEFFAAALELSPSLRQSYAKTALGEYARKNKWPEPVIVSVETQPEYPGTDCRPDMRLTLADGHTVLCEHKLDALETAGSESSQRDQLKRYLALPSDGVLYVRSSWKPPHREVLEDKKYIRPREMEHFLWRDFYHMIDADESVFMRWLKDGFERLGFTPPHPSVGELGRGKDPEKNRANRLNFAKLWGSTRSFAHELGWKVGAGSIVELYMWNSPSKSASRVYVCPALFERFLIRVTPKRGMLEDLIKIMEGAAAAQPVPTEVNRQIAKRKAGKVEVVDVTTSMFLILGKDPQSAMDMERKLHAYVTHFLKALQA